MIKLDNWFSLVEEHVAYREIHALSEDCKILQIFRGFKTTVKLLT